MSLEKTRVWVKWLNGEDSILPITLDMSIIQITLPLTETTDLFYSGTTKSGNRKYVERPKT